MATRTNQRWPAPAKLKVQTRGRRKMDAEAIAASVARGVESPGELDEDEDAIELDGAPRVEEPAPVAVARSALPLVSVFLALRLACTSDPVIET